MNRAERAKYETRTKVLKALAHPARLKLVDVLAEQDEVCVCELTEVIGMDMSTVSRHLSQLKNAGIVESDKRGQMVFYRLRVKCLKSLFSCIESVVKCNVDQQLKVLS
ncbi:metalloregulator ArsR/SmtB family transcription factor [Aeoliella sp. ICT_H6.2]|uniref:Metalloregulator ArsR/SmtB family transcription factor n=1 Tax=Aeoliella straminimaris TaxID=2954799 RepID=A0A9X2F941_9BACT|nr:metalloregulator ArsR/SmtB family transcription factor [Aeoliella straminimaris]MCO6043928.1 metalloregulator ArsR/SmtB family transcription factor [Aeoliella straminimaris]